MTGLMTSVKREATVQGITYAIDTVTGEKPNVIRSQTGAKIVWKPGQASKVVDYLLSIGKTDAAGVNKETQGKPSEGLNVDIPLSPVIVPYVFKKFGIYLALYTAGVVALTRIVK